MLYIPRVNIQSSTIYRMILDEMCMHERFDCICHRDCDNCIIKNHVEGIKWLRSMGININVVWYGSVLPNRLSQWIISRRIKKVYRGYTHPFWIVYSATLTVAAFVPILIHFGLIK